MDDERIIELLIERLVERTNKANATFLESIGSSIKKIKKLTPTQAQQLIQILKYGGNYEEIVRKIAKIMNVNISEVDKIFSNYAIKDQLFNEKFYKYRNIPFIKYAENEALKRQTMALANITKQAMYNFTRSNAIGYSINGKFYNLRSTYEKLLDEALLNVGQGKETFDSAIRNILKEIGGSGLRTLDYESGRQIRLDSMVSMHLKDGLRTLHNENQRLFGKEYDADGVEISVHLNPAPDHEEVQGRQFSNEEFDKFQNDMDAVDYKGRLFPAEYEGHDRRSISQYNCYHDIFSIVLGVSEPAYSDEELQQIIDDNHKGFELDGKHYTNYEGTQMQRALERKIREQKDIQILAKASGNDELIAESQTKITQLTNKYKELSQKSGLPTKMDRLRVSGYKRIKVNTTKYTKDEKYAINKYISPYSIGFNEKLRNNIKLDDVDKKIKKNLDSALIKSSYYKGNIFRELEMNNPEEFINQLEIGKEFSTNQYLSFSTKKGYNEFANIKIYIENSEKSRDFRAFNAGELETLYERNKKFITKNIVKKKGIYYILWEEK